jgi:hypothetical protein
MADFVHDMNNNVGLLLFLILCVLVLIAWSLRCLHRDYDAVNNAHEITKTQKELSKYSGPPS